MTWVLTEAGDHAAAERTCAAALARSRDAGDMWNLTGLLAQIGILTPRAGRLQDAAAHLREAVQVGVRTDDSYELLTALGSCGDLCVATGRLTEAITVWAAWAALSRSEKAPRPGPAGSKTGSRPGKVSDRRRDPPPRNAGLRSAWPPRPNTP